MAYQAVGHLYAAKLTAHLRPKQIMGPLGLSAPLAHAACRVLLQFLASSSAQIGPEHIPPEEISAAGPLGLDREPEPGGGPEEAVAPEDGFYGRYDAGLTVEERVLGSAGLLWEAMQDVERREVESACVFFFGTCVRLSVLDSYV